MGASDRTLTTSSMMSLAVRSSTMEKSSLRPAREGRSRTMSWARPWSVRTR